MLGDRQSALVSEQFRLGRRGAALARLASRGDRGAGPPGGAGLRGGAGVRSGGGRRAGRGLGRRRPLARLLGQGGGGRVEDRRGPVLGGAEVLQSTHAGAERLRVQRRRRRAGGGAGGRRRRDTGGRGPRGEVGHRRGGPLTGRGDTRLAKT
ncbi:hypothetical protein SDC9_86908 [bioreactor metagenome]|uniref:Uncharacterized protein n=1 Tax=bioreactor metagenome TaxID=1076179 RepID=A0A644ZIV5_9ZZZZ